MVTKHKIPELSTAADVNFGKGWLMGVAKFLQTCINFLCVLIILIILNPPEFTCGKKPSANQD